MITKKYKWLIAAVCITSIALSCKKDVLDVKPTNFVSDVAVFEDITLTSQFLTNVYSGLLSGFERKDWGFDQDWSAGFALLDMATDDIEGHNDLPLNKVQSGDLTPTFAMGTEMWRNNYMLIRKANTLIGKIDGVPTTDAALKGRIKAEAKFLRAFAYSELVRAFGGVPLIVNEQLITDDLQVPRNNYEECVNFIVKECDEAATSLPFEYGAADLGRATKGAALALKARVLLYYASPLNNPSNDITRWTNAANAAKAVMDIAAQGYYSLHPDYYQLFFTKAGNKEVIFAKKFARPGRTHQTAWMLHMSIQNPDVIGGAWGGFHATQNLVNAYEMKNGKLISDPTSGYEAQNPYKDRDSRLDKSLIHNGSVFKGVTVETFEGGNANKPTNGDRTKTGYGLRKFIDERFLTADDVYRGGDNDWIYMRYAEVLLNYAEARNEAVGADGTVEAAINEVRRRSGQPALNGLSQVQMRDRIRNERRVELSFEEHRFYDVRRWKLGLTYFNVPIQKMKIVKNANSTLTFTIENYENRGYKEYYNVLPIPQMEMERNSKLIQNPSY